MACRISTEACPDHGIPHGKEAEELRAGVEKILESGSKGKALREELTALLERVDARDSLAFTEIEVAKQTRPEGYPVTPNLDRMLEVKNDSQLYGEFLEWLFDKGTLCKPYGDEFMPIRESIPAILAEYFEVDLEKMERERRRILEWMRTKDDRHVDS